MGLAFTAAAQQSKPMSFTVFAPCSGSASVCGSRILADGVIGKDTPERFRQFLKTGVRSTTICFNSQGGHLFAGLELGRDIRKLRLDTCLESQYEELDRSDGPKVLASTVQCASACAMAFLGGHTRSVEAGKQLFGVHQFAAAKGSIGDSPTQMTLVLLAKYVQEMGVNRGLLDIASIVEPTSIRWLTQKELLDLRVDNTNPASGYWELSASPTGVVIATIRQLLPENYGETSLSLFHTNGQHFLAIRFTPSERTAKSALSAAANLRAATTSDNPFKLVVDGSALMLRNSMSWNATGEYAQVIVPFDRQIASRIRLANTLGISVNVAQVIRHLNPTVEVSLDEARGAIAAALR